MTNTKKYKLVKASNKNDQSGGRGYTITMPLSPFSSQFSAIMPALPNVPQSVMPSFGPVPALNRMGPIINLNAKSNNWSNVMKWFREAKDLQSSMSEGVPSNFTDTYTSSQPEWSMGKKNSLPALIRHINVFKTYYTGAGGLFIELNTQQGRHSVILFADKNNNKYQDIGGGIDPNDFSGVGTLATTARREIAEESRNLFNISPDFNLIDYNNYITEEDYKCYIFALPQGAFSEADYTVNVGLIDINSGAGDLQGWKETNNVNKFYVDTLKNCLATYPTNNDTECDDATGTKRTIRGRTIKILRNLFDPVTVNKYNSIVANPRSFTKKTNTSLSGGLKDTRTIIIS